MNLELFFYLQCLQKWEFSNSNMLTQFVYELYTSYLQYQHSKIESYHLKDEFKEFLSKFPEMAKKSEIQITKGGQRNHVCTNIIFDRKKNFYRIP